MKLNRYLTHIKRLDVDRAMVARSYDTMGGPGPKAAVVLVQLPARFRFDPERLARFFAAVAPRRRRHALEPRDASWLTDEAIADFVYLRFHGQTRLYAGSYDEAALRDWAERIRSWRDRGLDALRLRELVG